MDRSTSTPTLQKVRHGISDKTQESYQVIAPLIVLYCRKDTKRDCNKHRQQHGRYGQQDCCREFFYKGLIDISLGHIALSPMSPVAIPANHFAY